MNPLLIILNPRRISECLDSLAALDIPKAYLTGYTERGLVDPFNGVIKTTDYSHYLVISDDGVVRQDALDAVLDLLSGHPVATGWCNIDSELPTVNLTRSPLTGDAPHPNAYDLYHWATVMGWPSEEVPTFFAGGCLTGMSRELWQRFPFDCYGELGNGSDFHLCLRLQQAEIPIGAARSGFVYHVKETWNRGDREVRKHLHLGEDVGVTFA